MQRGLTGLLRSLCCLGFSSRSNLSFTWLAPVFTSVLAPRVSLRSLVRKSAPWIIWHSSLLSFALKSFGFYRLLRSSRRYEFRASPSLYRKSALEIGRSGKAWFPLARALGSALPRTACPSDSAPRNDGERKHEMRRHCEPEERGRGNQKKQQMICHPEALNQERRNSRVCSGSYPLDV